jgi:flagellar M-ring protein FliF
VVPIPTEPVVPELTGEMDRKRAEVEALADRDPEKTAEYLRNLMDDRQPV